MTFAVVVVYDALRYSSVASGELLITGLAVINLRLVSSLWDEITDADVLHRLRLAENPCSDRNLARHLGRRPGPVDLSLLRLFRAGLVAPVDSVNGMVR
ncbi:hypothetical protein [Kitasatospora sp. NPDC057015]|uniref:hypothetical protein n=1 Tax=Kitasatospora sp. NPDC057015 TaxID=3346001 RepID=UPI0036334DF9